jgi:predicted aspartyl protease
VTIRPATVLLFALVSCAAAAADEPASSDVSTAPASAAAPVAPAAPTSEAAAPAAEEITEIVVRAPEARYVSPTRRDRIGRIWAPVFINDKGPFRLVLDTGASRSCVTAGVARDLGLEPESGQEIHLQAVTGSATVPTIHVDSLLIGDLLINDVRLPIIPDALGGAEGILGNEGLRDRRVYIDFRHDLISITHSHNRSAPLGLKTVPFKLEHGRLLTVYAWMGNVRARAIIDTGGQSTVGNLALRDALRRRLDNREQPSIDHIAGVTAEVQDGEGRAAPAIDIGPISINTSRMTFADLRIFEYWKLTDEPTLLIGMDALGLLDTLIIDYRRNELQLRMRQEP